MKSLRLYDSLKVKGPGQNNFKARISHSWLQSLCSRMPFYFASQVIVNLINIWFSTEFNRAPFGSFPFIFALFIRTVVIFLADLQREKQWVVKCPELLLEQPKEEKKSKDSKILSSRTLKPARVLYRVQFSIIYNRITYWPFNWKFCQNYPSKWQKFFGQIGDDQESFFLHLFISTVIPWRGVLC